MGFFKSRGTFIIILFVSFVYFSYHNTMIEKRKYMPHKFAQISAPFSSESPQISSNFTALQFPDDAVNGIQFCQRGDRFIRFQDVNWRGSGFKHKQADFLSACKLAIKLNRHLMG